MPECIIELRGIYKDYDGSKALKNINLKIHRNEFMTLLGPSGCGKTTTLRIIGGFEQPTQGQVFFDGASINATPPYQRRVNTVFQRYALFPHLNVYENIAFGLRIKKLAEEEISGKIGKMLKLVNLSGFEKRAINSLSGGQQQRIAIARALVNEPEVLLLDEPLGALDLKLRQDMQIELKNMQQALGITFIYVTHDQEEALTMSDSVVVMSNGEIQQIGSPVDIYNEPQNAFVADFIGESNIIEGVMLQDRLVEFASQKFECVDHGFGENQPVDVVVRPEDIKLVNASDGMLTGEIKSVIFKGVHYEMLVENAGFLWIIHDTLSQSVGTKVGLDIFPNDIHIMKKELG